MATGNQPQNQNRRIRFNGIEGLISAIGVGACAIGGYVAYQNGINNYNDEISLQAMYEIITDSAFLKGLGVGAASAFTLGLYRLGRRHGRS
ncbi:hypothetical protein J4221_07260 [Candidatus Pacearchaeota archaeon]|nr:hypothetical protein [Candidatus Pacearchaeota archaeon]